MSSTNKTTHYEFPQYIGSDIPNILTDINPAFETIDTALYEQGQQITESEADLSTLEAAVTQATSDVTVMQGSIATMAGVLETTRALATDNKETIGQGTLDTTAQTLIGGVNELNDVKPGKVIASYKSSTTDTYAQAFNSLFNQIEDPSNVPANAKLLIAGANIFHLENRTNQLLQFSWVTATNSRMGVTTALLSDNSSYYDVRSAVGGVTTYSDNSSLVINSELNFEIIA